MKVVFIGAACATLYLIYIKFKATYDRNHDTFRIEFLILPAFILALLINHDFTVLEVSTHRFHHDFSLFYPILFLSRFCGHSVYILSLWRFCHNCSLLARRVKLRV